MMRTFLWTIDTTTYYYCSCGGVPVVLQFRCVSTMLYPERIKNIVKTCEPRFLSQQYSNPRHGPRVIVAFWIRLKNTYCTRSTDPSPFFRVRHSSSSALHAMCGKRLIKRRLEKRRTGPNILIPRNKDAHQSQRQHVH